MAQAAVQVEGTRCMHSRSSWGACSKLARFCEVPRQALRKPAKKGKGGRSGRSCPPGAKETKPPQLPWSAGRQHTTVAVPVRPRYQARRHTSERQRWSMPTSRNMCGTQWAQSSKGEAPLQYEARQLEARCKTRPRRPLWRTSLDVVPRSPRKRGARWKGTDPGTHRTTTRRPLIQVAFARIRVSS